VHLVLTADGEETIYDWYFDVCLEKQIVETGCGNFSLTNDSENYNIELTILAYSPTFRYEQLGDTVVILPNTTYSFTLPAPGMYKASIKYDEPSFTDTITEYLPYMCTVQACMLKLVTDVLCIAEADPCCKECNNEALKKNEADRLELNKLMALYSVYVSHFSAIEQFSFIDFNLPTDQEEAAFIDLAKLISKISDLTNRCSSLICIENQITVINCGCNG
jgi:hypothetical protein